MTLNLLKTPAAGHRRPPKSEFILRPSSFINDQKSSNLSNKPEPKWGLDPNWSEHGSGETKKGAQPHHCQPVLEVIFKVLEQLLQYIFSRFFGQAFFSILRRLLSAQGPEKGAESRPKWTPKRVWRHPLGSVKSMAGAVFSTH